MQAELSYLATAAAALAAVLLLVWIAQKAIRLGKFVPARAGGTRLLTVRDVTAIDARRRLYLIECDTRRVLIMTGGPQDVVVGWLGNDGKIP